MTITTKELLDRINRKLLPKEEHESLYLSKKQLRRVGWSTDNIEQYLGEPDKRDGDKRLWLRERADAIRHDPELEEEFLREPWQKKSNQNSNHDEYEQHYRSFKMNVLKVVDGLPVEVEDVPLTLLKQKQGNPVPEIRHVYTNYERLLKTVAEFAMQEWGDVPFPCPLRTVDAFVKKRVTEEIAARYPRLRKKASSEIGKAKTRICNSETKNGVWEQHADKEDK